MTIRTIKDNVLQVYKGGWCISKHRVELAANPTRIAASPGAFLAALLFQHSFSKQGQSEMAGMIPRR